MSDASDRPTGTKILFACAGACLAIALPMFGYWHNLRESIELKNQDRRVLQSAADSIIGMRELDDLLTRVEARRRRRFQDVASDTGASARELRAAAATDDSANVAERLELATYPPRRSYLTELTRELGDEARMWRACVPCAPFTDRRWRNIRDGLFTVRHVYLTRRRTDLAQVRGRLGAKLTEISQAQRYRTGLLVGWIGLLALACGTGAAGVYVGLFRGKDSVASRVVALSGIPLEGRGSRFLLARRWFRHKIERGLSASVEVLLSPSVFNILSVAVFFVAPLHFLLDPRRAGLAFWWPVILLYGALALYRPGLIRLEFERRVGTIHGSLSGNIDSAVQALLANDRRRLTHAEAHALSVGLLSRMRSYAELAFFPVKPGNSLRVTLAVPIIEHGTPHAGCTEPTHLRVWCYDQPYDTRNWTLLPMGVPGGPAAFSTGNPQVLPDLADVPEAKRLGPRHFQSVICVPVRLGGQDGRSLGVVSIDSTVPGFFGKESVPKVTPLIMPAVKLLALVLGSMADEAVFEFGH